MLFQRTINDLPYEMCCKTMQQHQLLCLNEQTFTEDCNLSADGSNFSG